MALLRAACGLPSSRFVRLALQARGGLAVFAAGVRSGALWHVFNRILIVCVGNVCRSPMAEFLLRQRLAGRDVHIASAGFGALVGHPVEGHAMALLHEHGMDASVHRARQLEPVMLRDADLVLAMERRQVHAAARLAPEASGKVFLLRRWADDGDVPDPHLQSRQVFESVYALIDQGVDGWLPYL